MEKYYRVIVTDNCDKLEDIRLASFDTLEEAETYSPDTTIYKKQGYKYLEIYPRDWAHTAGGYAPFARKLL